jgi:hypothetical protein
VSSGSETNDKRHSNHSEPFRNHPFNIARFARLVQCGEGVFTYKNALELRLYDPQNYGHLAPYGADWPSSPHGTYLQRLGVCSDHTFRYLSTGDYSYIRRYDYITALIYG